MSYQDAVKRLAEMIAGLQWPEAQRTQGEGKAAPELAS